jgi:transcriptional regulator of arginine metabolism
MTVATDSSSSPSSVDANRRREAIRRIVRMKRVGTQGELVELLAEQGYDVTQATLSRDLTRLGARRVTLRDGGTAYEIDAPIDDADELGRVGDLVIGVEESIAMVVVLTRVGAAPAVAIAIDKARLPEVAGTLAGDDAIFVAPSKRTSTSALTKRLRRAWKLEKTT